MKQEDWLKIFKTFYDDQNKGSGAWLVSPKTVELFISNLIKRKQNEAKTTKKRMG